MGYRIALIASPGGHLDQLLAARAWWEGHERFWVVGGGADVAGALAGERVIPAVHPSHRSLRALVGNLAVAWRSLRAERPDVIVTDGAAVAVPFVVLGRALGIPSVYLEVCDRLDGPSLSARLCRPFVARMAIQDPRQRAFLPDAVLVGRAR